jgi:hypothetical protein
MLFDFFKLGRFDETHKGIEEEDMAKKNTVKVTYTLGDVPKANFNEESGTFRFRCPVSMNLPPKGRMTVNLGAKLSRPCLLIAPKFLTPGLDLENLGTRDADVVLTVTVVNNTDGLIPLDPSLCLVVAAPLGDPSLKVEE